MSLYKQKTNQNTARGNRLLISITVAGSADPIRFVVNELELVAAVIDTALKSYAREGRLRQTKRTGYTEKRNHHSSVEK